MDLDHFVCTETGTPRLRAGDALVGGTDYVGGGIKSAVPPAELGG